MRNKAIIAETTLYRALAPGETFLKTNSCEYDMYTEATNRVLDSSRCRQVVTLRCATEDPRIAIELSKSVGYSGLVAKIPVVIYEDGSTELKSYPSAFVQRLWAVEDWLHLAADAGKTHAECVNYKGLPYRLSSSVTYCRRNSRALACNQKIWVIADCVGGYRYDLITSEEQIELENKKYYKMKSYKKIHYFNPRIVYYCDIVIDDLKKSPSSYPWYECSLKELQKIRSAYVVD